jgi:hypothetical protein
VLTISNSCFTVIYWFTFRGYIKFCNTGRIIPLDSILH